MPPLSRRTLASLPSDVPVPAYDREALRPGVVHIGVGGFHRAHQAVFHDRLLARDPGSAWGICGVGVMPGDAGMRDVMAAQDGLYTLVVKHPDGTYEPRVIGSILEYLFAPEDPEAVVEKLAAPETRIASLTITEGAYDGTGEGPAFELLVAALGRRRERGVPALAVVSCDNLQGNGAAARRDVVAQARRRDGALADWIEQEVVFPDSMVDRITPVTTDADRAEVRRRFGIDDAWPVVCEPYLQWVLEDRLPAGRPAYADVGVQLVDDVVPFEQMKVRLLNGGHQALGYLGLLAGLEYVHEAASDRQLRAFVADYMRLEAEPTLAALPGVSLESYEQTLLDRFSSEQIRDTLARQCVFGSDRIRTFVVPVIRDQLAAGGEIDRAATIVAAWARYATGIDAEGRPFEVVDHLGDALREAADRDVHEPGAFLSNGVFGDLAGDERLLAAYRAAVVPLREHGARAALERVVR